MFTHRHFVDRSIKIQKKNSVQVVTEEVWTNNVHFVTSCSVFKYNLVGTWQKTTRLHLHHYFDHHVCLSICPASKNFSSLKSPWNHPLTPRVDLRGWPRVPLGHAAPPEELARAQGALSSLIQWSALNMQHSHGIYLD